MIKSDHLLHIQDYELQSHTRDEESRIQKRVHKYRGKSDTEDIKPYRPGIRNKRYYIEASYQPFNKPS